MSIKYCTVTSKEELEQILTLQQANLWTNVNLEEKEKDGFVTVEHNFDILQMFTEIDAVVPKDEKYMAMGQICVGKNYRNQGIFRGLYNTMKQHVQPDFDSIITEVDAKNTRSLLAHYAVGFKELKTYFSDGRDWILISLK